MYFHTVLKWGGNICAAMFAVVMKKTFDRS